MIRRIILENFMSHRHTVIDPSEGLTLLSGPNNCGKSAVVVALQTLCENDSAAKKFIRHGAKEARVYVETDEGHQIEWRRPRNGSAYYILNGRRIDRVGQGVPEDLHELLRLPQVRDDKDKRFDVHFADQKSPIFLLDSSGERAATFFASSSDAGLLLRMQTRHRQNVDQKRKEQRSLQAELAERRQELGGYAGLATLEEKAARARDLYNTTRARIERAAAIAEKLAQAENTLHEREAYQKRLKALEPLAPVPAIGATEPLATDIQKLESGARDLRRYQEWLLASENLAPVPQLADPVSLSRLVERLQTESKVAESQARRAATLAALAPCPDLPALEEMAQHLGQLEREAKTLASLQNKAGVLDRAEPIPALDEDAGLRAAVADLEAEMKQTAVAAAEFEACQSALADFGHVLETFVLEHPSCPTCGSRLDPAHLAEALGGAAHA